MARYILRRLILTIPILVIASVLIFAGARVVPGDANLSFLLADPFLMDEMKPIRPVSHAVLDAALRSAF